jgi:hypothetical protein
LERLATSARRGTNIVKPDKGRQQTGDEKARNEEK